MIERLTWAEIERRYPDEWVLLADPELTSDLDVVEAQLVFHSKSADEVSKRAAELRLRDEAFLFTGEDPFAGQKFLFVAG
jgi:hypothetical protein